MTNEIAAINLFAAAFTQLVDFRVDEPSVLAAVLCGVLPGPQSLPDARGGTWYALGEAKSGAMDQNLPLLVHAPSHDLSACGGADKCTVCRRLLNQGWDGDILTTKEVAGFFVDRAYGLGEVGEEWAKEHPTHAPSSTRSMAHVTLEGACGPREHITPDVNQEGQEYWWFDLKAVPVGSVIYRTSMTPTYWLFTKRTEDTWTVQVVECPQWPNTRDGGDFSRTLQFIFDIPGMVNGLRA